MNQATRKISADEVISHIINTNDINTLRSMKDLINGRIDFLTNIQGPGLNVGDRVYFINQRSRKLNQGKVFGTIEKVNIVKAKVRVDITNAVWNVPFGMLTKI